MIFDLYLFLSRHKKPCVFSVSSVCSHPSISVLHFLRLVITRYPPSFSQSAVRVWIIKLLIRSDWRDQAWRREATLASTLLLFEKSTAISLSCVFLISRFRWFSKGTRLTPVPIRQPIRSSKDIDRSISVNVKTFRLSRSLGNSKIINRIPISKDEDRNVTRSVDGSR